MANVNFGTFTTVSPKGGDYLVGYRNNFETKTSITSLTALNAPYVSSTTTLKSNSAKYEAAYTSLYTDVSPKSGLWNSTYTTVGTFSSIWAQQPDLSLLQSTSSNWNEAYFQSVPFVGELRGQMNLIKATSGTWNEASVTVATNYNSWNNAASGYQTMAQAMQPVSAKWTSVYTTVNANSANYILNGGNATGSNLVIGTNDSTSLSLRAGNLTVMTIVSTGGVQEGTGSIASGTYSHAEGVNALASGNVSHAQNFNTIASGYASHAEGGSTVASKQYSHAAGYYVQAAHDRSWAWKGSTATNLISTTRADQFLLSAAGGVYLIGNVGIGTDENYYPLRVKGTTVTDSLSVVNNVTILGNLTAFGTTTFVNIDTTIANVTAISAAINNLRVYSLTADVIYNPELDSVYSTVNSLSDSWEESVFISELASASGKWNSVYSSTNSTSGNWNSVYSTVKSLSDSWEESAFITDVALLSGNWNSVYSSTKNTSGNWNNAYTATAGNSSTWNNWSVVSGDYVKAGTLVSNYLPLSGGTVTGDITISSGKNLTVTGNLSVLGDISYIDTTVTVTSALSVVNLGTGPALVIKQTGTQPVANFLDDNVSALYIGDGGKIGINTSQPGVDLTVNGIISANNSIIATDIAVNGGSSNLWNSAYTSTNETSGTWNSTYTSVRNTSGNWNSVYTSTNNTSANWNSVHSSVRATSALWNSMYSALNTISGRYESNYNLTNAISGNWILDGGNTKGSTLLIGTNDANTVNLETNNLVRVTILGSNGNVGINNVSPSERLAVGGSIIGTGSLSATGSNDNYLGGSLGIGTNVVGAKLHVVGAPGANLAQLVGGNRTGFIGSKLYNENSTFSTGIILGEENGSALTPFYIERWGSTAVTQNQVNIVQTQNAPVTLHTNNAERVRVTNAGFVGINTVSPGYQLTVNGDISATGFTNTFAITTRALDLVHSPANDGINPILRIGEIELNTFGTRVTGFSGFSMVYDETRNVLNLNADFGGVSGLVTSIDRNGIVSFANSISAASTMTVFALTSRALDLVHYPANDGINPILRIGEGEFNSTNTAVTAYSGFNVTYDEARNTLNVNSDFGGVTGSVLTLDRYGSASANFLPYTVTFTPFVTAAGNTNSFYPASLSGVIPFNEITSRMSQGKGRLTGLFFYQLSATAANKLTAARLEFANNPTFANQTNIIRRDVAAADAAYTRNIDAFFVGQQLVFHNSTSEMALGQSPNNYFPYFVGGDIFYRVGFNPVAIGQLCALSGGYISIIP